jgi:Domain of unknown function (DUF4249)
MKKIVAIVSIVIACSSCSTSFEQVVEIKSLTIENLLVPNSMFNNAAPPAFLVTRNGDVNNIPNVATVLQNATINVTENGLNKGTWTRFLDPNTGQNSNYYFTNFVPQPNNIYKVSVTVPGFPTATATDTMPSIVPISVALTGAAPKYIQLDNFGGGPGGGQNTLVDTFIEVKITFKDNIGTDYYRLVIANENGNNEGYHGGEIRFAQKGRPAELISNDIVFSDINNAEANNFIRPNNTFFTDVTFEGKTKSIIVSVPIGNIPDFNGLPSESKFTFAHIWLQHLSRHSYLYNIAFDAHQQSSDNPFTQPTILYTNYQNGLGAFGCVTSSYDSIKVN